MSICRINLSTMKVRDVTITRTTQNVYSTFSPLYVLMKLFALNLNGQRDSITSKSQAIFRYVVASVVLGSINFYTLFFKISHVFDQINPSIKFTDATQMIYDFWQYIADLYYVYKYGRDVSVEYFKQYENIDRLLGVASYSALKVNLLKLIGVFISMWLLSSSCDFAAWVMSFGWLLPIIYAVAYVYLLIKILTTLDLSAHTVNIGCRLRSICDSLQECYRRVECVPEATVDYIYNKHWLYSEACSRVLKLQMQCDPKRIPYNITRDVKSLSRCYLMLTEQVAFINKMYGIRIVLNMLSFLIDMIRLTNLAVKLLLKTQHTDYDSGYFPAISSLMRLFICVAIIMNLVYHCEGVYRESDNMLNIIDHLLINKKPDELLREDVIELRGLIQSRPIRFNMANFFCLNYSLLISLASVVVTYTIIILQSLN